MALFRRGQSQGLPRYPGHPPALTFARNPNDTAIDMADEASSVLPHEEPLPPRTDLWTGAAFLVLGLAIVSVAWRMPTFKEQKGEIYTAPGLVPGIYGLVISALSIWLVMRSVRRGRSSAAITSRAAPDGTSNL